MAEKTYALSYTITDVIIGLAVEVAELVGIVTLKRETASNAQLRRENQVRSIHASLALENASLSLDQVRDAINDKRLPSGLSEHREVKNAYEAYNLLPTLDPFSVEDMLSAHGTLMAGLTEEAGRFRSDMTGNLAEERPAHTAPPAVIVPKLTYDLVSWASSSEVHLLIKSCIFHHEFEFIHPFASGSGRMARMWRTLLLSRWKPIFAWLPVETLIRERQKEYHDVLATYENAVDSTAFIEFMLRAFRDALTELLQTEPARVQVTEQIERLLTILGKETLSSKEMMVRLKLKHRPSFRDNYLLPAISLGLVEMTIPDKPNSNRQRYRTVNNST